MEHGFKGLMDLCKWRSVQWTPLPAWFREGLAHLFSITRKCRYEPIVTIVKSFTDIKRQGNFLIVKCHHSAWERATLATTHMLSWVHRLWVDILPVVPYDNLSPGGHTLETSQYQDMETCHRWQFPTAVHRKLKEISNTLQIKEYLRLFKWMNKIWICFLPQTSDLMEKVLYARLSGAVHLMGNLAPAWAVYVSPVISLLRPKSATFTTWFSPTKQFLAARSLRESKTGWNQMRGNKEDV